MIECNLLIFIIDNNNNLKQYFYLSFSSFICKKMLGHNPTQMDSYNKNNRGTLIANWF